MTGPAKHHLHVVVMGVSGTGKSVVGRAAADELGLIYGEGDDHHPAASIEKMAAGVPLDDTDRGPWLDELARWTRGQHDAGHATLLTCSALKRSYRDVLRGAVPEPTVFVHLVGSAELLASRMARRTHFMPPALLTSQLRTLEPLEDDELGGMVDTDLALGEVVAEAVTLVRRLST